MLRHLREELTGGWVKLNNGEARDCTASRVMLRWAGYVARTRRKVHAGFWCGNLKETQFYRPGRRGEDNIKMDFNEKER